MNFIMLTNEWFFSSLFQEYIEIVSGIEVNENYSCMLWIPNQYIKQKSMVLQGARSNDNDTSLYRYLPASRHKNNPGLVVIPIRATFNVISVGVALPSS